MVHKTSENKEDDKFSHSHKFNTGAFNFYGDVITKNVIDPDEIKKHDKHIDPQELMKQI